MVAKYASKGKERKRTLLEGSLDSEKEGILDEEDEINKDKENALKIFID